MKSKEQSKKEKRHIWMWAIALAIFLLITQPPWWVWILGYVLAMAMAFITGGALRENTMQAL